VQTTERESQRPLR